MTHLIVTLNLVLVGCDISLDRPREQSEMPNLTFHASFDGSGDAQFARGDRRIFTAQTYESRSNATPGIHSDDCRLVEDGKFGGAIEFTKKSKKILLYKAAKNVDYSKSSVKGTVAFWLKLDPATDLEPGYCDPIQITDKKWNDSSFFVDFTDKNPRDFRLGVFSNYSFWNPKNVDWDKVPSQQRPLVTVKRPQFSKDEWTHVAFVFRGINEAGDALVQFFIDGKSAGSLKRKVQMSWETDNAAIMIGINYVGFFDELTIFDAPLNSDQIHKLMTRGVPGDPGSRSN